MSQPQYILPPFDPTAYPSISGAQLYQFGTGLFPNTGTGFTYSTTDVGVVPIVPDANTYPELKAFLWKRNSAASVGAYLWNDTATSDPTYLKWVSINIAALGTGVIQGYMIADNTITDSKIIALDYSKLTGVPTGFLPSGAAGGDLTGTYPDPSIATSAVTTTKIADLNVTTGKINDLAITLGKINPSAVAYSILRTNVGATAVEWLDSKITQLANPASAADVKKIVSVANPYTNGFELVAPSSIVAATQFTGTPVSVNGLAVGIVAALTEAHGLGAIPSRVELYLKCTSTHANFTNGDIVSATAALSTNLGASLPTVIWASATQVGVTLSTASASWYIINKTTGILASLDVTKWSVFTKAML